MYLFYIMKLLTHILFFICTLLSYILCYHCLFETVIWRIELLSLCIHVLVELSVWACHYMCLLRYEFEHDYFMFLFGHMRLCSYRRVNMDSVRKSSEPNGFLVWLWYQMMSLRIKVETLFCFKRSFIHIHVFLHVIFMHIICICFMHFTHAWGLLVGYWTLR